MRVLILDIDTLRPDHIGCYGYHRNTTPNIDRIAREGTRFTNYYCSDAPCLPSRVALVTGQHGIHSGVVTHGGTTADMRHEGAIRSTRSRHERGGSLHSLFRYAGYHTCFVGPFIERHAIEEWGAGFMETHNSGKGGHETADDVSPLALDWIERNGDKENWYLYVNLWDPHASYKTPDSYPNPFVDDPPPDWVTQEVIDRHRAMAGSHCAADYFTRVGRGDNRMPSRFETVEDWKTLIDAYDTEISFADMHVGRILSALEQKGVWEDLLVIVTSDHGENMGELGIYCEHDTATQSVCNIPLVMKVPGIAGGRDCHGLHYNLDLMPTLDELFELRAKVESHMPPITAQWDGESFADAVRGGADSGRDYLVLSQLNHTCQRGVRWADWIYTYSYHDGFRLQVDEEMLFNLKDDPHQTANLAAARPELCHEAAHKLHAWHTRMMKTMPYGYTDDPLWTVIKEGGPFFSRGKKLDAYCAALEKSGRAHCAAEYRRRHPEAFDALKPV